MMAEKKDATIIGDFSITVPMPPNNATLSIKGFIFDQDDANAVSRRMDELQDVAARQAKRNSIELLRSNRKAQLVQIEQFRAHLADLTALSQRDVKLNQQQKDQLKQGDATIAQVQRNIKQTEADIAEIEEQIKLTG